MSLEERTVLSDDRIETQALALTQNSTISAPSGLWTKPAPEFAPPTAAGADFKTYFYSFRRHWILALGMGLLLSAILGPIVYWGIGDQFTAYSYLNVSFREKALVFSTGDRMYEAEYEIFKSTQLQMMKNRFVIASAVRKPEIARLPILKKQQDPVSWLMDNISVSFPGKAELMEIKLTTYDAQEAADIVTAVLDAYMSEVVEKERDERRKRISDLERIFTEKEGEVRNRRNELKQLAEQLGTAEKENLNLKQKLTLEELSSYRQELVRSEFDVGRLRGDLAARNAELHAVEKSEISDFECETYAQSDPMLKNLSQEIMWRKMDSQYTTEALKPGSSKSSKFANKYQDELARYEKDYADRMEQIRDEIRRRRQNDVEKEIKRLEAAIEVATKQQQANEQDVQRLRKLAEQFGSSSIDVEMMRADIENRERALNSIATEKEKLRVELRSTSRITSFQTKAEKPRLPSNFYTRLFVTIIVSVLGLFLPIAGIVLWDTQFQRINTAADISDRLKIPVVGTMPVIPSRVLRQLGSPSKRNQSWQLRLTESVDGITARLLRRAELEQRRVVMITSAISGEGKTTLAAQLAMSLARAGRNTILVDFDLRQPSFDEAFGLARSPGVSEILRNECDLSAAIQQTATNNLSILSAGRWNRLALSALANGAAFSLFKELRDDYEFVVIDTSPILPIADSRFVSQYVDSVILCVFRDISEAPRIRAACEILEAFGVQCVEAAVTGASESDSSRSGYYHSSFSA